jgi:hypothetical protein
MVKKTEKASTKNAAAEKPKSAQEKLRDYGIERICAQISDAVAQRTVAAEIGVSWSTMTDWVNADPTKIEQYARAREAMAHKMADEIHAVAGESCLIETYKGEEVVLALCPAMVARNRLRVDALKWSASKLLPRIYGDKIDMTSGGEKLTFAPIIMPPLNKTGE